MKKTLSKDVELYFGGQSEISSKMKIFLCLGFLLAVSNAALPYYREYGEHEREYPQMAYGGPVEVQESSPFDVYQGQEQQDKYTNLVVDFLPSDKYTGYPPYVKTPYCIENKASEKCELERDYNYYLAPDYCGYTIYNNVNYLPHVSGNGRDGCIRTYCPGDKDVISVKFFNDHICVYDPRFGRPDVSVFCPNYRPELDLYQAMIITASELTKLRGDIQSRQNEFYTYRNDFPPLRNPPSNRHFFTASTYNFYECKYVSGKWKGKQLSGRYQAFIPRGTAGDPKGLYKIYHGCPPTTDRPPSGNAPGNC